MNTLLVLCGLPLSGKTTWATTKAPDVPIVSPDAVRRAVHGQRFILEAEPHVWAIAQTMVRALFLAGHSIVIVDATNTTEKRRAMWRNAAWRTEFVWVATSKEVCLERANDDPDIQPVIERMAAQWEPFKEGDVVCHG